MDPSAESTTEDRAEGILTPDDRWLLAKRIARSQAFARSDRLSKLLLYVCRLHLSGRGGEINEQRIGIDVFRRKPSFDSGSDSIVRSHATRLRQRLDLYFSTEGSAETLRVEIPRGGYSPRFYSLEPAVQSIEEVLPAPAEAASVYLPAPLEPVPAAIAVPESRSPKGRAVLWFLGGFAVSLLLVVLFQQLHGAPQFSPGRRVDQTAAERRFWDGIFHDGKRTLVVTGDSGLVLYETFGKHEVSLTDYVSGNYRSAAVSPDPLQRTLDRDLPSRRYTSVADLNLAIRFNRLPQWDEQRSEVIFARDLRAVDAAKSNLVLIGSRTANPWVSLVDESMNFTLTADGNGRFYFLNRHPVQGEQPNYMPSQPGSGTTDSSVYALICYRPQVSAMGKILLVSGLWQSGTQAAGNYVLGDPQFSDFLRKITKPDGSIPGFELLVQVRSVAGNAFTSSIIANRVQ